MSESYVRVPTDSTGKILKTWMTGSGDTGSHAEAMVLTLADATNSFVGGANPLPVNISGSRNSLPTSGSGIYTYASAQMVTGSININNSSAITGSINNWPTAFNVSGSGTAGNIIVTGSTYQSGQWTVNTTGSGITPLPVSISGSINKIVSGSGIYTYASSIMITGSVNLNSVPTITAVASGSGIYTQASAQMVTGSININSIPTVVTSGSGIYTYASSQMVTGSININNLSPVISGSGVYTQASAIMITGAATIAQGSGSSVGADSALRLAMNVSLVSPRTIKNMAISGSLAAAGTIQVVGGVAGKMIKVFAINLNIQTGASAVLPVWAAWCSGSSTTACTGTDSTRITGPQAFESREGYTISVDPPAYLFIVGQGTGSGGVTGLGLWLSGSTICTPGGFVSYWTDDISA